MQAQATEPPNNAEINDADALPRPPGAFFEASTIPILASGTRHHRVVDVRPPLEQTAVASTA